MSRHDVGECDACGTTTRGEFCSACRDRVDDASKAFADSLADAIDYKTDDAADP